MPTTPATKAQITRTQVRTARPLRRKTVAALAATVLLAAACGDDDQLADTSVVDSGDDGTDEDPEESETGDAPENDDQAQDTDDSEPAADDEDDPGALLLIMDSSGSMNSRDDDGERLIDGAKQSLRNLVEELPDDQHVGLRVYGHRYPNTDEENGCTDTELIHPVEPLDQEALLDSIDGYDAEGWTPIGLSLQEAADDLPPEGQRTIVLVSDGQETCDTDPCQAAEDIATEGIDLVVHTVGFVLDMAAPDEADQAREELSCVAEATGGQFYDVDDANELTDTLEQVTERSPRGGADGDVLEGGVSPSRANTGQVNTTYNDTILGGERLFYHFEVPSGSEVTAEARLIGNPDDACDFDFAINGAVLSLVDASDNELSNERFDTDGTPSSVNELAVIGPEEVDNGEVFIKIDAADVDCDEEVLFDLELELVVE